MKTERAAKLEKLSGTLGFTVERVVRKRPGVKSPVLIYGTKGGKDVVVTIRSIASALYPRRVEGAVFCATHTALALGGRAEWSPMAQLLMDLSEEEKENP